MDETPKDQSDPNYMKQLPDAYLYLAICKGGAGIGKSYVMSPWGDFFTDQEIRNLIAWVRTFSNT
jgi:cytochrome c553